MISERGLWGVRLRRFQKVGVVLLALLGGLPGQAEVAATEPGALSVFICGSSSPLADLARAQACVAVYTDDHYFLFDTGSGSGVRLALGGLPSQRLSGVFITHFHSDHISDLYPINLTSWASGRGYALPVFGPVGIAQIVDGMNSTYALDRSYRVAHHGAQLLVPEYGILEPKEIREGVVFNAGGLVITAFSVKHSPIEPALGYRVDFHGRSVVISGDTTRSASLIAAAKGADLLIHGALSPDLLDLAVAGALAANVPFRARILADVADYHTHTTDVAAIAAEAGVRKLALYHLVPPPRTEEQEAIFMRRLPNDVILTRDMMRFELPVGSEAVLVSGP